ncbi:MAG: hypothetical protein Kow0032_07140 [Methyloligellaceae bacterium]
MQLSIFSAGEHPAKVSASPGSEKAWMIRAATWPSSILPLLNAIVPAGLSGKMSPAFCHREKDGILAPSSGRWANSGMGSLTECWTLSSCEHADFEGRSPSDGAVCSLSAILETGAVPQRYYLTAKACAGILRRAAKRGKTLPPRLEAALMAVVSRET